jgi:hypothetical protein
LYTEEELKAANLDDFRVFLRQAFDFLGLPPPSTVQNDQAWELQHGGDKLIIQAFRGVGKSLITVIFVCWLFLRNPQLKIMVVSATAGLAYDFAKFVRQLIEGMPILAHLAPGPGQLDSMEKMDVGPATPSKDPSLKCVGITGQLTGSRADIIVADDIEVPKNSFTHLLREKIFKLVSEFTDVLKPGGRVIYLGTPQVEDSLYPKLIKERGFRCVVWPAEVPSKIEAYAGRLGRLLQRMIQAKVPAKTPVEPIRFPEEVLIQKRMEGAAHYALQYMLDTTMSDVEKKPLRCRDLIVSDVDADQGFIKMVWGIARENVLNDLPCGGIGQDFYVSPAWKAPEMAKFQGTVMIIDPSGRGRDETGLAIVRYLYGQLYLVKSVGFTDGFGEDTLEAIAKMAIEYGVTELDAEANYGGGMFLKLLKPVVIRIAQESEKPCPRFLSDDPDYKGNWSSTQKEMRICDTLEPLLRSHRLVVDRRVIEEDLLVQEEHSHYSLIQQLTRMERVKAALPHEDRLEALAMACAYWTEQMDRDKNKMEQKHKDNLLTQQLKAFVNGITGRGKGRSLVVGAKPGKPRYAGRR